MAINRRAIRDLPKTILVRRDPDPTNEFLFAEETLGDMAEAAADGEFIGFYRLERLTKMRKTPHLEEVEI